MQTSWLTGSRGSYRFGVIKRTNSTNNKVVNDNNAPAAPAVILEVRAIHIETGAVYALDGAASANTFPTDELRNAFKEELRAHHIVVNPLPAGLTLQSDRVGEKGTVAVPNATLAMVEGWAGEDNRRRWEAQFVMCSTVMRALRAYNVGLSAQGTASIQCDCGKTVHVGAENLAHCLN